MTKTPETLTAKQAKWVTEYLACGNASASAVKAGYSPNGASVAGARMLRNASVKRALEARQAADATRLSITRESVLKRLLEAFELAREKREPMAMVRAAAEVGKMLGFYAPTKLDVDVKSSELDTMARFERMSDRELTAIIEGAAIRGA
jgi:phage terminase small subunit